MKFSRILICFMLCVGMTLTMAGCQGGDEKVSSQVESSAVESASSQEESSESEASSQGEASSQVSSTAPESGFEAEFEKNPIDEKYNEDMAFAGSYTAIQRVYFSAAADWQTMIDTAYQAAAEALPQEEVSVLQAEQSAWLENCTDEIASLQERAAAGSDDDALNASKEIMELYRDRAKALCLKVYEETGSLPRFITVPETTEGPVG